MLSNVLIAKLFNMVLPHSVFILLPTRGQSLIISHPALPEPFLLPPLLVDHRTVNIFAFRMFNLSPHYSGGVYQTIDLDSPSSCSPSPPCQTSVSSHLLLFKELIKIATEAFVLASNGPHFVLQSNTRSPTDQQFLDHSLQPRDGAGHLRLALFESR